MYLAKNQKLTFDLPISSFLVKEVDANKEISWRYGVPRFHKIPLAEVERILRRGAQCRDCFSGSANYVRKITGELKNEHLMSVLQALYFALDASYTVEGNLVTIKRINDMRRFENSS